MHDDDVYHSIFFWSRVQGLTRKRRSSWARASTSYSALDICVVTSCSVVHAVPYPAQAGRGSGFIWPDPGGSTSQCGHATCSADATMARMVYENRFVPRNAEHHRDCGCGVVLYWTGGCRLVNRRQRGDFPITSCLKGVNAQLHFIVLCLRHSPSTIKSLLLSQDP